MYLTTMEFIKTETPIQICDIGASPIDKTDFIEELLINSNSKLIGFEPNSVEFEKLNQRDRDSERKAQIEREKLESQEQQTDIKVAATLQEAEMQNERDIDSNLTEIAKVVRESREQE